MSRPFAFVHGAFGRLGLVDMDTDLATHVHHHLHVVIKAGGGDAHFRMRDRTYPVTDDNAVLVNAWEPHALRRDPAAAPTLCLTLYLEPAWLFATGLETPVEGARAFFAAPCVRLSVTARHVVRALAEIMAAPWPLRESEFVGEEIARLVFALIRALRDGRQTHARPRAPGRVFDYRIRRALDLLHLQEGALRIDAVAREVGLSRPRFFELFQQCTGFTPSRVVNAARMERAIGMLTQSRTPMGDMALDLGFATQGNFSRFFKQQIGVSPNSFRRAAVPVDAGAQGRGSWSTPSATP